MHRNCRTEPGKSIRSESWNLSGRRALVTGGTRGIGAAVATCLAESGARVLVTARSAPEGELPTGVAFVAADVASSGAVPIVVAAVERVLGGIDIVVHGVGASFTCKGGALGWSDEDWLLALETNLLSAVLANEFAPAGIRINTVTPGFIATSGAERRIAQMMAESGLSRDEAEARLVDLIGGVPLGRAGTAAEVAELVTFVVSDAASYLSGTELTVDGGNCQVI